MEFSIENPDEYNEDYLSRSYLEVSDKQFLSIIAECLIEEYCQARVLFVRKGYSPEEGSVIGNSCGATLNGPLDDVYRIAKKLKRLSSSAKAVKAKPTKYSHLRLVE